MTIIRVIPEQLQDVSRFMSDRGGEMRQVVGDLSNVLRGLDPGAYEGQLYSQVAGRVGRAQGAAAGPLNRLGELATNLAQRALKFLNADQAAQSMIQNIHDGFVHWQDSSYSAPSDHPVQSPGFGPLLAQMEKERKEREAAAEKKKQDDAQWWKTLPLESQKNLTPRPAQGIPWACAPTAVSYVLAYWHRKNSNNKLLSAQELVNLNLREPTLDEHGKPILDAHGKEIPQYSPDKGMSLDLLVDDLNHNGYEAITVRAKDSTVLETALLGGPVLVDVRENMSTGSYPHTVVVVDIKDGQVVYLDPEADNPSIAKTCLLSQFEKSWATMDNAYMTIHPQDIAQ